MQWNTSSEKRPATPIRASWANPARSSRLDEDFSRSNVKRLRQFHRAYPKSAKASHLLNWSHYLPDREELRRELELTLKIAADRAHPEKD
jgi:hypothetical protein